MFKFLHLFSPRHSSNEFDSAPGSSKTFLFRQVFSPRQSPSKLGSALGLSKTFTRNANAIFRRAIDDYHRRDDVDTPIANPYESRTLDHLLYRKNWIDTVQWHLEDIIRNPEIDPAEALAIKRRIDCSNQERTDMVEYIDSYLLDKYREVPPAPDARINTETPAWAVDRLSILALKIYHMEQETLRTDVDDAHLSACRAKLEVLRTQQIDLSQAIEELLADIEAGRKYMKTYKQMKMYNDPALNPVLYGKK